MNITRAKSIVKWFLGFLALFLLAASLHITITDAIEAMPPSERIGQAIGKFIHNVEVGRNGTD